MDAFSSLIMMYLIGGLLAAIPLVVWGILFFKRGPERKDVLVLSFSAGVMSVIPIFLVIGALGNSPLSFGNFNIPGLNIYAMLTQTTGGGIEKLGLYILVSILAFFLMYVVVGFVIFLLDIISGQQSIKSYEKILSRSLEAPLLFVILGTCIGTTAYFFDWTLGQVLYANFLVGAVEEFAKHLVMRFSDENKLRTVADAIELSIMVALGFAFLENVIYFVDYTWLSCDKTAITSGLCTWNPDKATYVRDTSVALVKDPGVLLQSFLGRSLLSTLTHIVSSAFFGYFYGIALFARDELKSYALHPERPITKIIAWAHRVLHVRSATVLKEQKMLQGALAAMIFHGFYNFCVDPRTADAYIKIFGETSLWPRLLTMGLAFLMLATGLVIVFMLLKNPKNNIVWANKRVLEKKKKLAEVEERLTKQLAATSQDQD